MEMADESKLKPIAPYVVGQVVGYVPKTGRPERQWLLGHCIGKPDEHVKSVLKQAKIEEYYPQIREWRPVPRRLLSHKQRAEGVEIKRPSLVPLLPRYRLLHVDPERSDLDDIFALAGIGGLVCEGGRVIRVPESFVDGVRKIEQEGAIPGTTSARVVFRVGDEVRISGSGPFAQFSAVVQEDLDVPIEALDPDVRIRVAIALLGRPSLLELPLDEVEKL